MASSRGGEGRAPSVAAGRPVAGNGGQSSAVFSRRTAGGGLQQAAGLAAQGSAGRGRCVRVAAVSPPSDSEHSALPSYCTYETAPNSALQAPGQFARGGRRHPPGTAAPEGQPSDSRPPRERNLQGGRMSQAFKESASAGGQEEGEASVAAAPRTLSAQVPRRSSGVSPQDVLQDSYTITQEDEHGVLTLDTAVRAAS